MDGKLQAILGDEAALAKIAAIVKGVSQPEQSAPPVPTLQEPTLPTASFAADNRLALLAALRPFLKESRRARLDSLTKVMNVAKLWQTTKHI